MAAKSSGRRRVQSYLSEAEYEELQELYGAALRAGRTQARSADSWVGEWVLQSARATADGLEPPPTADPEVEAALDRLCARYLLRPPAMIQQCIRLMDRQSRTPGFDPFGFDEPDQVPGQERRRPNGSGRGA